MKKLLPLILCLAVTSANAQQQLYGQTTGSTGGGTASQDFEAINDAYDCMAADDFTVPTGETWYIDSIIMPGSYSATSTSDAGAVIHIYNDNSGSVGTLVTSQTITANMDPDGDGTIVAKFGTPIMLTSGDYWLGGAARKDFGGGGGQWYWARSSATIGSAFQWQNPGNGFATGCTTYSNGGTCLGVTDPGLIFEIYGCYGPTKPTIAELPDDTAFCEGPSVTLNASSSSSNISYVWNNGATTSSITVDSTGYYKVIAIDTTTGCGAYSDINIEVFPSPSPEEPLPDTTTCENIPFTFNAYSGVSTDTYLWQDGSTGPFHTASVDGWYSVTISSTNGCTGVDSAYLTIEFPPPPSFPGGPNYQICEGDTITLGTAGTYSAYQWSTGEMTEFIEVADSGTYAVTVTTAAGCNTSGEATVSLYPTPVPAIEYDTGANFQIKLDAGAGYASYLWSNGSTSRKINVNFSGFYSVTVTNDDGCEGEAEIFALITSVDDLDKAGIKVYPNPSAGIINVEWPSGSEGRAQLNVTDVSGRMLWNARATGSVERYDISHLPQGLYLLRISTDQGESSLPLILE